MKRRDFLKSSVAAAAFAAPAIIPARLLGRNDQVLPSNKITMACIGVGWQGTGNMENFLRESDCQVVVVCDLDEKHLEDARRIVNSTYHNND
ncbi:gfo/Idh/MocA family oxidoreductase, partial [candidate division KSB1 bacterium]